MKKARVLTVLSIVVVAVVGVGAGAFARWSPDVPMGSECRALVKSQSPVLRTEAELIVSKKSSFWTASDCDSGAGPVVNGVLRETSDAVVARMRARGEVHEVNPTECTKYLPRSECPTEWRYTPRGSSMTYVVELPRGGDDNREWALAEEH